MKDIWALDCSKFRELTDRYFRNVGGDEQAELDYTEFSVVKGLISLCILSPLVNYADGNEKTLLLATKLSIDSD
jgi:hypothetical protein